MHGAAGYGQGNSVECPDAAEVLGDVQELEIRPCFLLARGRR
jgi:hypothetical protein